MGRQHAPGRETLAGEIRAANEVLAHYDRFGELYVRLGTFVYSFALRQIGNPEIAQDITQQAFVKAWQHYSPEKWSEEREHAWLGQITMNLIRDYGRHNKCLHIDSYDALTADGYEPGTQEDDFSEAVADRLDNIGLAAHYLGMVSEANRASVWLYYGEEYGPQEIGKITDTTRCTAATRAARGMQQIRQKLENNTDAA